MTNDRQALLALFAAPVLFCFFLFLDVRSTVNEAIARGERPTGLYSSHPWQMFADMVIICLVFWAASAVVCLLIRRTRKREG